MKLHMNITIRKAVCEDSDVLTDISFKSKRYWDYPEQPAYLCSANRHEYRMSHVWQKKMTYVVPLQ